MGFALENAGAIANDKVFMMDFLYIEAFGIQGN